jgi:hypothetical protein
MGGCPPDADGGMRDISEELRAPSLWELTPETNNYKSTTPTVRVDCNAYLRPWTATLNARADRDHYLRPTPSKLFWLFYRYMLRKKL